MESVSCAMPSRRRAGARWVLCGWDRARQPLRNVPLRARSARAWLLCCLRSRGGSSPRTHPSVLMAYATRSIVLLASRWCWVGAVRAGCQAPSLLCGIVRAHLYAVEHLADRFDRFLTREIAKRAAAALFLHAHCCSLTTLPLSCYARATRVSRSTAPHHHAALARAARYSRTARRARPPRAFPFK